MINNKLKLKEIEVDVSPSSDNDFLGIHITENNFYGDSATVTLNFKQALVLNNFLTKALMDVAYDEY